MHEERFAYSAFPGRYATPAGGAMLVMSIALAYWRALSCDSVVAIAAILLTGVAATTLFALWMLRRGVLDFPLMRAEGVNLFAVRGEVTPKV